MAVRIYLSNKAAGVSFRICPDAAEIACVAAAVYLRVAVQDLTVICVERNADPVAADDGREIAHEHQRYPQAFEPLRRKDTMLLSRSSQLIHSNPS